ncbi:DUF3068 domain-containing protein [Corynebacterium sp.]|uniref:DUF3068 domain-containing protein n=1 Tax=Corynebacterium sp. TaxID=1720 RepID=UPI0026DC0224|nr:DUF3068 domain-containing protein [Corynebacterium sp.]MDO5033186.1 DUF3068 domain-containing protein [Corynebacterium sp.]
MLTRLTLRSRLAKVVIAAVVFLLIGSVLPPLYNNQRRPLPMDLQLSVSTEAARGPSIDIFALLKHELPAGAEKNPACRAQGPSGGGEKTEVPIYCYRTDSELTLKRVTTTSQADKEKKTANTSSLVQITADGQLITEINETALLNRESTYPVAGPNTSQNFKVAPLHTGVTYTDFESDGLQYFFPSGTEQRSYPYFDLLTQQAEPIDFTGTEKLGDIPSYTFHQSTEPVSISEALEENLAKANSAQHQAIPEDVNFSGPARLFYDAESLKRYDLKPDSHVIMDLFYSVVRDVWVEPTTGTILDVSERVRLFWATDQQQAQKMLAAEDTGDRSLVTASFNWDEATKSERLDSVRPVITATKVFSMVGWGGKAIGVVLLAGAAAMFMRRHNAGRA